MRGLFLPVQTALIPEEAGGGLTSQASPTGSLNVYPKRDGESVGLFVLHFTKTFLDFYVILHSARISLFLLKMHLWDSLQAVRLSLVLVRFKYLIHVRALTPEKLQEPFL